MASGAVAALRGSEHIIAGGVVVAAESSPSPFGTLLALQGDHPLPGRHSFAAARRIGEAAAAIRGDDLVVVLLSGGASSLVAAPLQGIAESDLERLFTIVMDAGLDIGAMNAVRKRFTLWGAGRLALALVPARTQVLLMSDVPGDDPANVGSGPCSPDPSRVRDVIALLEQAELIDRIAPAMRHYLAAVARGILPETPKPGDPAFARVSARVIGTNSLALDAAVAHARALSLDVERMHAPLTGDAARCGHSIATSLLARAERGETGCVVWGGETTVRLSSAARAGTSRTPRSESGGASVTRATGGRCQELALAAARTLSMSGPLAHTVTLLAAGTDGRDGPTDAAGAFADAEVWRNIEHRGLDPEAALARHESYAALNAAGALFRRGPTGTNVMDVVVALVE